MLSAGMFAARAASVAALSRRLPFGSPPPWRAATVISRRIFEKSFPRWTSVLPFFRLICDHRECPDMAPSPSFVDRCLQPADPLQPSSTTSERALPPSPLGGRRRLERRAGPWPHVHPQVHERQVRRACMPLFARPWHLGEDLDANLEGRRADVIQAGLERHDLVARDRR